MHLESLLSDRYNNPNAKSTSVSKLQFGKRHLEMLLDKKEIMAQPTSQMSSNITNAGDITFAI